MFNPAIHFGNNPFTFDGAAVIYCPNEFGFGYRKAGIKPGTLTVRRVKYAQYDNAVEIQFVPVGKRKPVAVRATYAPRIVILPGTVATTPAPESMWTDSRETDSGLTVRQSARMSNDDGWDTEMDRRLTASGVTPILDLRGYNTATFVRPDVSAQTKAEADAMFNLIRDGHRAVKLDDLRTTFSEIDIQPAWDYLIACNRLAWFGPEGYFVIDA